MKYNTKVRIKIKSLINPIDPVDYVRQDFHKLHNLDDEINLSHVDGFEIAANMNEALHVLGGERFINPS